MYTLIKILLWSIMAVCLWMLWSMYSEKKKVVRYLHRSRCFRGVRYELMFCNGEVFCCIIDGDRVVTLSTNIDLNSKSLSKDINACLENAVYFYSNSKECNFI